MTVEEELDRDENTDDQAFEQLWSGWAMKQHIPLAEENLGDYILDTRSPKC